MWSRYRNAEIKSQDASPTRVIVKSTPQARVPLDIFQAPLSADCIIAAIQILSALLPSATFFFVRSPIQHQNPGENISIIMLPSRLFRNVGFAPAMRSLSAPGLLARASVSAQARSRIGAFRANSSATNPGRAGPSTASLSSSTSQEVKFDAEPRLAIALTCTADECNHRSAHTFTKRAYERGIVIIQCPSCKNR